MTVNAFVGTVAAVAGLVLLGELPRLDLSRADLPAIALLIALAAIAQRMPVYLFRNSAISVAYVATIATYVLYGTPLALVVNLASAAVNAFTPRRKPMQKVLFNGGSLTIAAACAGATYEFLGSVPPVEILPTIAAVAVSGIVYFAVSSVLTSIVIALSTGGNFVFIWRENYAWMTVNYGATAVIGAMLALSYRALGFFGAASFILPLGVAWYSFKLYVSSSAELRARNEELQRINASLRGASSRLEEAYLSGMRALVEAVEAKDESRRGHSAATATLSVALAKRLGIAGDELVKVEIASLIHDIGRVGVSEDVLLKNDWLSDDEWTEVKRHPIIGANLLAHVPALAELKPIVLAHHERFDGSGYPFGRRGEEIPLAARIIAVADAYQAMISPRPYRPALKPHQALLEIAGAAGTQFDRRVVDALLETRGQPLAEPAAVAVRV